jgi:MarR family transcriptional regulator, organic hydroperoxide resistance regulator
MQRAERTPDEGLGETLEFMRLLWSVDHALQRTSKRMDRNLGVTGPQRLVIRVLGSRPGLSAGDVAWTLKIHPSTLTGILKRLEQRKIIRRVSDPKDARRVFLHLNGLGETLNAARTGTVEEAVERALEKLPAAQVSGARRVLEALVTELEVDLPADNAVARKAEDSADRQ